MIEHDQPFEELQRTCNRAVCLLQQYTANPEKEWPNKDCALHMVMALAVKGKTAAAGATSVNELVNVEQFCEQHVMPELSTADVNERPVLKADGLRCASAGSLQCLRGCACSAPTLLRHVHLRHVWQGIPQCYGGLEGSSDVVQ